MTVTRGHECYIRLSSRNQDCLISRSRSTIARSDRHTYVPQNAVDAARLICPGIEPLLADRAARRSWPAVLRPGAAVGGLGVPSQMVAHASLILSSAPLSSS
jgi:hypothetical protein